MLLCAHLVLLESFFFLRAAAVVAGVGLGDCLMKEFDTGILCLFCIQKKTPGF